MNHFSSAFLSILHFFGSPTFHARRPAFQSSFEFASISSFSQRCQPCRRRRRPLRQQPPVPFRLSLAYFRQKDIYCFISFSLVFIFCFLHIFFATFSFFFLRGTRLAISFIFLFISSAYWIDYFFSWNSISLRGHFPNIDASFIFLSFSPYLRAAYASDGFSSISFAFSISSLNDAAFWDYWCFFSVPVVLRLDYSNIFSFLLQPCISLLSQLLDYFSLNVYL